MGVLNSAYYNNIVNLHLNIFVITTIGVYGTRPPLPAVGGGEGVGVVTSVGEQVTTLSKGDHVVIAKPGIGKNLRTTNQYSLENFHPLLTTPMSDFQDICGFIKPL